MNYQTALITGAASGIGRELARQLAQEGVAIAALDLDAVGLQSLMDELSKQNRRCAWVVGDVTNIEQLNAQVSTLEAQLGPIDLLIASAGVGMENSALDYRAAEINRVLNVNLLGVSNSIAAVLPGMLVRRRGHLVALSSLASYLGMPRMLGYCASKAGVNAIMEGVRGEVKPFGIHTTTVCPGWIQTPMTERLIGNMPMMAVAPAARRIVAAIHRKKSFVAFPPLLVWRMRLLKWSPIFVRDWLIRSYQRGRLAPKPRQE